MRRPQLLVLAASAALLPLLAAPAAKADPGDRSWSRHGRLGHDYSGGRSIETGPGRIAVERRVEGDRGRGVVEHRETTWGDGTTSRSVRRAYAGDASSSWSRTGSLNGDGSATRSTSHAGVRGGTRSGWTTVYRSDQGFGRSQGFSGSNGRGGTRSSSVVVGDRSVTIDRRVQTNRGREHSSTRTFQRR